MDERRRASRHRVLKRGTIVLNGGRSTISCVLRNLSASGALLRVENTLNIPGEFVLMFDQATATCQLVRRSVDEIAVSFAELSDRPAARVLH